MCAYMRMCICVCVYGRNVINTYNNRVEKVCSVFLLLIILFILILIYIYIYIYIYN